jgi:FkbM family methyltransferase
MSLLRSAGNKLYQHAFPIYRPLYSAYKSYADRAERNLLRRILFPGAVVVDAGANIGIYSVFLARCVGPTGVVHSFEPAPENFTRLRAATRALVNVRANSAAVGERSGKSQLYVSEHLNVDHRAYAPATESRSAIEIEMVALDDYFKPGATVDLIKLDLQGYELHALRGAKRVLSENPAIKLLLELWPHGLESAGVGWHDLVQLVRGFGMNVLQLKNENLVPLNETMIRMESDWYINLFASRGELH